MTRNRNARTVLVIEDDPGILEGLRTLFELSDLPPAAWASSAAEAMWLLDTGAADPSLILVDGRLPDCHGIELIGELRSRFTAKECEIYLFSADSYSAATLSSLAINGYIRKPFDADELIALASRHSPAPKSAAG
jgi:DNA-binding response OmpR family regulator